MAKKQANLLDAIPCVPDGMVLRKEEGLSVMAFPRFKSRLLQRLFAWKGEPPYGHVTFDEHGTAALDLVDGRRTVREIIALLAPHFEGEGEGYEARVALFFSHLHRHGLLKMRG